MRFTLPSWVIVLTLVALGVAATRLVCPGCVDRTRRNAACVWTGDSIFPVETGNSAHWQHLIVDAQLAEELAVEYADANFSRWAVTGKPRIEFGTHAQNVRAQGTCLARLDAAIESAHAVSVEQIASARRARNPVFDLVVVLLFVPLYGAAAKKVCGVCRNVLFADARFVRFFAFILTSVSVSGLGLLAFALWRIVMEGMRVGNPGDHMGNRAAGNYWSHEYAAALFMGGVLLFWVVSVLASREAADQR